MLAIALREHRAALRASLRAEYQIDLREELAGETNLLDLADLVEWLPAGAALWRSLGGPAALTVEQRELRRVLFGVAKVEYVSRGDKAATKPKPDPEPEWAHERRAQGDVMSAKAAAHAARERARST